MATEFIPYEALDDNEKEGYKRDFFDTASVDLFPNLTYEQASKSPMYEELVAQYYDEAAIPLAAEAGMLSAAQKEADILGNLVGTQKKVGEESLLAARRAAGQALAQQLSAGGVASGASIGALAAGSAGTERALGGQRSEMETALSEAQQAFAQATGTVSAQKAESAGRVKEIKSKAAEEVATQAGEQMSTVGVGDPRAIFASYQSNAASGGSGTKTYHSANLIASALEALKQGNIAFFDEAVDRVFNTLQQKSGTSEYNDGYIIDYTKDRSGSSAGVPFEVPSHFTSGESLDDAFVQIFGVPRDQVIASVFGG